MCAQKSYQVLLIAVLIFTILFSIYSIFTSGRQGVCRKILPGTIREACLVSIYYNPLTFSSTWDIIFSLEVLLLYAVLKNQTDRVCKKHFNQTKNEKRPLGLEDGLNMFNTLRGGNSQKAHQLLIQGFWLWLNDRLLKVVICDAPNLIKFSNQKNINNLRSEVLWKPAEKLML